MSTICQKRKLLIDTLEAKTTAIKPHPFYIHPQTREVYIDSRFMMRALERMCTPESTSTRKKFFFF